MARNTLATRSCIRCVQSSCNSSIYQLHIRSPGRGLLVVGGPCSDCRSISASRCRGPVRRMSSVAEVRKSSGFSVFSHPQQCPLHRSHLTLHGEHPPTDPLTRPPRPIRRRAMLPEQGRGESRARWKENRTLVSGTVRTNRVHCACVRRHVWMYIATAGIG